MIQKPCGENRIQWNASSLRWVVLGVLRPNHPQIAATPVAIGTIAARTKVFKPAPETPRCAEIVAEACWAAGVPGDLLRFVRLADGPIGQRLIESVDGVILTGSIETARLFKSWRPDLVLLAETSGKNAMVITSCRSN